MRTDPHKETRPGHTWGFDILVWKTESVQGNKYSLIMRDYKTGKFIVRHMRQRSDLNDVMESVVVDINMQLGLQGATSESTRSLRTGNRSKVYHVRRGLSPCQKLLSFRLKQSKSSQTCILAQELFGRLRYSSQELSGHESSSSDVTHAC